MNRLISIAATAAIICTASLSLLSGCGTAEVEYSLSEDGTYYIVSDVSGSKTALKSYEIPPEYEGLPVKEIGEGAFNGCYSLTSIVIPYGIEKIGDRAFTYSTLSSVEIPLSVTYIGYAAFGMCERLTEVTIPESVTYLGERAFIYCSRLKTVYFKGNCDILKETFANSAPTQGGTVYYNSSLTTFYMTPSVKKIYSSAFTYDTYLSDFYFCGTEEEWNEVSFISVSTDEEGNTVEEKLDSSAVFKDEDGNQLISLHLNATIE